MPNKSAVKSRFMALDDPRIKLLDRATLGARWKRGQSTLTKDIALRRIPKPTWIGVVPMWSLAKIEEFENGNFDLEADWAGTPPKPAKPAKGQDTQAA